MSYRDTFESCPRCRVALVDAGSVRACNECRGMWVLETILSEMVLNMLPPGDLTRLQLAVLERGGEGLACPSCNERMTPATIHGVQLDRCPRRHGVWFDRDELEAALYRVATHGIPVAPPDAAPAPAPGEVTRPAQPAPLPAETTLRELTFSVRPPGQVVRDVTTRVPVVKIGRIPTAHVRIEGDDRVERMHAVIDVEGEPTIIDLGSRDGTLVNGARVNKQVLRSGDQILIGATTVVIAF